MKTVFRTTNYAEACLVRDLLGEHGIGAEISHELRSSGGLLPLDLTARVEVWIADEARADEARELAASVAGP